MFEGNRIGPERQGAQATRPIGNPEPQSMPPVEVQKLNHVLRVVPPGEEVEDPLPRGINASDVLAQWRYAPEDWERFIVAEPGRIAQMLKRRYLLMGIPILLFAIAVGVFGFVSGGLLDGIIAALSLGLFMDLFLGALVLWDYRTRVLWSNKLWTTPRRVLVTREAVIFGGPSYFGTSLNRPIKDSGSSLRVWVESGEERLLCFELTYYRFRTGREQVRVPIPAGLEAEAEKIAESFR